MAILDWQLQLRENWIYEPDPIVIILTVLIYVQWSKFQQLYLWSKFSPWNLNISWPRSTDQIGCIGCRCVRREFVDAALAFSSLKPWKDPATTQVKLRQLSSQPHTLVPSQWRLLSLYSSLFHLKAFKIKYCFIWELEILETGKLLCVDVRLVS